MANALIMFAKEILESEKPYHAELPPVWTAAMEMLPHYRADVACVLGSLSENLDRVKMLCIEVSKVLFEATGMPRDGETVERVKELIKGGLGSENEWVRETGKSMTKREI
jgi:hypothetical protein